MRIASHPVWRRYLHPRLPRARTRPCVPCLASQPRSAPLWPCELPMSISDMSFSAMWVFFADEHPNSRAAGLRNRQCECARARCRSHRFLVGADICPPKSHPGARLRRRSIAAPSDGPPAYVDSMRRVAATSPSVEFATHWIGPALNAQAWKEGGGRGRRASQTIGGRRRRCRAFSDAGRRDGRFCTSAERA